MCRTHSPVPRGLVASPAAPTHPGPGVAGQAPFPSHSPSVCALVGRQGRVEPWEAGW